MRRSLGLILAAVAFIAVLAPPASGNDAPPPLVVGIWPQNYGQFGEIQAAAGESLHLFRGRQRDGQFDSQLIPSQALEAATAGYSLGLNIQPKTGSRTERTGILYTDITDQLLARSGPYYDKLVSFANEVLALPTYGQVTHYIQFHSEANLQAAPGVLDAHPYSGTGAEYRECFALIRALFDELGVTDRIDWQVVLTRAAYEGNNGGPANWYPADMSLYDLVGVDSYHRPKNWLTPSQSFDSAMAFARSVGKPLWIDETGADEGGPAGTATGKAEWFSAIGGWVDSHRGELAGIVFSHAEDGGNWFVDSILSGGRATPNYTGTTWNAFDALVDRLLFPPPPPPIHTLTVTRDGDGAGSVGSADGSIACGSACAVVVDQGTEVVLTATPDPGSTFTGWSGAGLSCADLGPCTVRVDADTSVNASFRALETLTVTRSGSGSGSVASDPLGIACGGSCAASFVRGSQVTLTATASSDSSFAGWSGGCSGTSSCTVTLDGAVEVDARFEPRMQTVSVARTGGGTGSVTSVPDGIDCGPICSASFRAGTLVTLTPTPASGSAFVGWSGACVGTGTCTFTLDSDATATARFEPTPPTTTLPDAASAITYASWRGVGDTAASGGAYRASNVKNETLRWVSPRTTSLTWVARTGPDRGRASVTIDGVAKGTIDLYAATPGSLSTPFTGLSDATHTVIVKVLGTKRSASSGTTVAHDAFVVGPTIAEEWAPETRYGPWDGVRELAATDGVYRVTSTKGTTVEVAFSGTRIDWITSLGRDRGKASVTIDGVALGNVDLYSPSTSWGIVRSYGGLSAGSHRMVIKVLGTKNSNATGTRVVVDGLVVHP